MKIKELISFLSIYPHDAEVVIEASSFAYNNEIPFEIDQYNKNRCILIPEIPLTSNYEIID